MTNNETGTLFKAIASLYPNNPRFANAEADTIEVWHSMLQDLDYHTALSALRNHTLHSQFAPSIYELRSEYMRLVGASPDNADLAWQHVVEAIGKHGYSGMAKALDLLTDQERYAVNSVGWRDLCYSEDQRDIKIRFAKAYTEAVMQGGTQCKTTGKNRTTLRLNSPS